MNLTTIALSAVFAIVPCNLALAQGSDTCATAQPVTGPGPHGVGLAGSTPGPPSAAGCPTHDTDVWFSWTAPSTGQFAFRLCGTSVVGWTASVLDGCGGNALECRNFNCQYDDDRLLFQAVAGADYIFRISSVVSWASGTFYVEPFTPAANDECASPEALDTFGSFPFDLNLATGGSDLGTQCFHAVNDLWFEWTAPLSTLTTFSCVEPGIYLGLYSACGGVELECNTYNVPQGDSHLRFQTVAGASYLIRVGSTGTSNRASAMLDIAPGTPRVYGGNGHAYALVPDQLTWEGANAAALQQTHLGVQGHLATVSNAAENDFLTTFQAPGSWFGLYQDTTDPGFFEPSGGWKWVTGEPLNYTQWAQPHEPNNDPIFSAGSEDYARMYLNGDWADVENYAQGYLVEWDIQSAGTPFCDPANENSVGLTTTLDAVASPQSASGIHIEAFAGPYGQFAYLLMGSSPAQPGLPISSGRLCLGTQPGDLIGRYNVFGTDMNSMGRFDDAGVWQNLAGTSSVGTGFDVPLPLPVAGLGSIGAGQTWHFQLIHREPNGEINFSNGLSVLF